MTRTVRMDKTYRLYSVEDSLQMTKEMHQLSTKRVRYDIFGFDGGTVVIRVRCVRHSIAYNEAYGLGYKLRD